MTVRILVVEDNADNLKLLDTVLTAAGYVALLATDGDDGVRLAELLQPDLVLLDIRMPGTDGYEVAAAIRRSVDLEHTKIVAVTASAAEDRERIAAAGFDGSIQKPIDPETFVTQIAGFLRPAPHRGARPAHDA